MAKKAYVGVSNKARQVKNIYVGVGGKARKVVKGYVGVGGKARQFWPALEKMYVIFKGQVNRLGYGTLNYLNRYPTHSTDTPVETTTNSFAFIMKKLGMVKTSGIGVILPTRGFGFDQFWENDGNSDQWMFVNVNQAIQKTNTSTSSADSTNRLYIPINRVYLPKNSLGKFICQIKVDAKGTITPSGNDITVTVGLHYIDSNNNVQKFSDVDVTLLEDYSEQEFTLDNPSYSGSEAYVDYVSLDSFFNQDGYSTYVAVRNLLIQNAVYKNCLMVEEGAQLGFQSYCPVPVKKNSITIQYNGQTMTVNKLSGDDDVYFAWYYEVEEYGNVSYPSYYATIGVFAFSTKSFTTDGDYHPSATAGTYKGHSYAGIDTAYIQQSIGYRIGINDFPDIPKCDIAPMTVPVGITTYAIEYLGDALIFGKYYDADGVAHNTY